MTDDLIMPVLGQLLGGLDFSSYFLRLGEIPAGYSGSPSDYAALKKAGVPLLGYGAFITAVIKFLILAFIIFLLVRATNRLLKRPDVTPAEAEEILLLREIRDSLLRRQSGEL
jgi:large conductance mechanosensitive channel